MAAQTAAPLKGFDGFIRQVYSVKNPDDCQKLYDAWAETYNAELTGSSQDYVAPALLAQAVLAANGRLDGECFDAGCGTGLSGMALAQAGAKTIDGVDYSTGMLGIARKSGVYRHLAPADLTKEIPDYTNDSYDLVTCVGTLTHGHVGPVPALEEFVRITKKGGMVAATILDDIWETQGFKSEVDRLNGEGLVEVVSAESEWYRKGAGVKAKMLILRKR